MLFTQKQLEHRLGMTAMTIHNWRKGYENLPPFPCTIAKRGEKGTRVIFDFSEVKKWLHANRPKLEELLEKNECNCRSCRTGEMPRVVLESAPRRVALYTQV